MKKLLYILSVIIVYAIPLFANSVASITALKGDVTIANEEGSSQAVLSQKLDVRDNVITANMSKAQLVFKDDTIITVGKNSNFSIRDYVYETDHEPVAKFELVKGAMRTITGVIGKVAPQKFSVQTKTATIGIRGTNFTVVVGQSGFQQVYCTYGAISVTVQNEQKVVNKGYYIAISPAGETKVKPFSPKKLQSMSTENFGEEKADEGSETKESTDVKESSEEKATKEENSETKEGESASEEKESTESDNKEGATQEDTTDSTTKESSTDSTTTSSETTQADKTETTTESTSGSSATPVSTSTLDQTESVMNTDTTISSDTVTMDSASSSDTAVSSTTQNQSEVVQDVSNVVQNTTQTSETDKIETQKTYATLDGYGANEQTNEKLATVDLSINISGSSFDSAQSYVEESTNSGETWTYYLSGTPSSFTSEYDFVASFSSAKSSDSSKSNFGIGTTNLFKTVSDLSSDDEMSWGEWALEVTYDQSLGTPIDGSVSVTRAVKGLWVAGVLTQSSVLAAYQSTASYTGSYRAYDLTTTTPSIISASASLSVDFGQDSAILKINTSDDTQVWRTYDMTGVKTNTMSGSATAGGEANGNFYGDTGNSVGGNFSVINSGTTEAQGVYQVSTTETLQ